MSERRTSGSGRRRALLAAAIVAALVAPASVAAAPFGSLSLFSRISASGGGRAIRGVERLALSPDGRSAYAVNSSGSFLSANGGQLTAYSRDPASGALTQLAGAAGCFSGDGTDGAGNATCTTVNGMPSPVTVSVSPDGKFVYAGTDFSRGPIGSGEIAIFSRDLATGALTQLAGTAGCLSEATDDAACTQTARALADPQSIVFSADGSVAYVATASGDQSNFNGSLLVFSRDVTTGALTQLAGASGCLTYVPNGTLPVTGCGVARAMLEPTSLALAPGGHQLYVAASEGNSFPDDQNGAVAIFNVNLDGTLTQPADASGCINGSGADDTAASPTPCTVGKALHDANRLVVSGDGRNVYLAAQGDTFMGNQHLGAVDVFARNGTTGALSQLAGTAGCISSDGTDGFSGPTSAGSCGIGRALFEPTGVALSPDGLSLYVTSGDTPSSLDVFARDPASGALSQLAGAAGCMSNDGSDGTSLSCALTPGIRGADGVVTAPGTVSATCNHVYVAADNSGALLSFARQPDCTPPAPPPPPPPVPQTPVLSGLGVSPSAFFAAKSGGSITRKTGASVGYNDTLAALTSFTVTRTQRGFRSGRSCRSHRPRNAHNPRRCTLLTFIGGFTHQDSAGADRFHFSGRVGGHKLARGNYILAATPSLAGKTGTTATTGFKIKG